MRLSLLDRSRTRSDRDDAAAVRDTVARAVRAEALGYERFWVAEHHAVPGVASGSPAVLLAGVGAATTSIGLGSAGVMLPLHQPLVVAEQFLLLAALHPGRVELGIGRSLGFTAPVRAALRTDDNDLDRYADDVAELLGYLDGTAPVTARPAATAGPAGSGVPVRLLATGEGVLAAARLGLPVVIGGPVLERPEVADLLARYRREFRAPAARPDAAPHVAVSLDVLVADDADHARELALPEVWAMAESRQTGVFAPLEPVADLRARPWPDQLARRVEQGLDRVLAGDVATVGARLDDVLTRTGADELVVTSSTFDTDALAASDAAVARLVG